MKIIKFRLVCTETKFYIFLLILIFLVFFYLIFDSIFLFFFLWLITDMLYNLRIASPKPGHPERVHSPTPAIPQRKVVRSYDRFLKINVKHITDGQVCYKY